MGDKGKMILRRHAVAPVFQDKGKKEQQTKEKLNPREKRKQKNEKKKSIPGGILFLKK